VIRRINVILFTSRGLQPVKFYIFLHFFIIFYNFLQSFLYKILHFLRFFIKFYNFYNFLYKILHFFYKILHFFLQFYKTTFKPLHSLFREVCPLKQIYGKVIKIKGEYQKCAFPPGKNNSIY
jgi:hypothetical protein